MGLGWFWSYRGQSCMFYINLCLVFRGSLPVSKRHVYLYVIIWNTPKKLRVRSDINGVECGPECWMKSSKKNISYHTYLLFNWRPPNYIITIILYKNIIFAMIGILNSKWGVNKINIFWARQLFLFRRHCKTDNRLV